jgi:hypothetical protein
LGDSRLKGGNANGFEEDSGVDIVEKLNKLSI